MNKFIAGVVVTTGILFSAEVSAESITKFSTHMHELTHSKNRSIAYSIDTTYTRAGDTSQKIYLVNGMCGKDKHGSDCSRNAERVERTAKKDQNPRGTYWYAYSFMYADDYGLSNKISTALGQVKAYGVDKPIWIFKHRHNRFEVDVYFAGDDPAGKNGGDGITCQLGRDHIGIKKWVDVLIKADYSSKQKDNHSYFQVWINGELKCDIKDTIINKHTWSERFANKKKKIRIRYGIYQNKINRWPGVVPTRVVYFDEMKTGKSKKSVELNTNNPVD